MQVDNTLILVVTIFVLILLIVAVVIAYRRRIKIKVLGTEFKIEPEESAEHAARRADGAEDIPPAGAPAGHMVTGDRWVVSRDSPGATIVAGDRDTVLSHGRKR